MLGTLLVYDGYDEVVFRFASLILANELLYCR